MNEMVIVESLRDVELVGEGKTKVGNGHDSWADLPAPAALQPPPIINPRLQETLDLRPWRG